MKKLGLLFFTAFIVLTLTGCGEKKVTCTANEEDSKGSVVGTFKDERLVKMEIKTTSSFKTEDEANSGYSMAQLGVGMLNSLEGVEGKVTKDGMDVNMNVTADISKMTPDDIKDMFDAEELTIEEFKSYAQKEGFTCE